LLMLVQRHIDPDEIAGVPILARRAVENNRSAHAVGEAPLSLGMVPAGRLASLWFDLTRLQ